MRVVFTPLNWPTHYRQQVPLAWALRAAGHDVLVACGSGISHAVHGTGMVHAAIGDGYDFVTNFEAVDTKIRQVFGRVLNSDALRGLTPEEHQKFNDLVYEPFAQSAAATVEDLVAVLRDWQADLLITDAWVYASPMAAQLTGVPLIRHLIGPDLQRASFAPGLSGPHEGEARSHWPAVLLDVFDRFGVEIRDEYANALIDPCPESLQLLGEPTRLPMQFIPYNGPGRLPAWLREPKPASRPRICVTWGTMTGGMASQQQFRLTDVVRTVAAVDAEVVLAITPADAERLGPVPDGVRLAEELPLHLLLPSCDAIVHQGGSGTLLTSVRAGVPQVIVPEVGDQTLNAQRLAAAGAGINVDASRAAEAGTAVATVLAEPGYRQAALALREELLARPTPAEVVRTLEELVGKDLS